MLPADRGGESGVEVEDVRAVEPQRAQGIGHEGPRAVRTDAVRAPVVPDDVAVDARLAAEPAPPRPDVDEHRQQGQHPDGGREIAHDRPHPRAAHAGGPPRRGVEDEREHGERGEPVDARPLHRTAQPEQHAGREPPPAHAEPGAVGGVVDPALGQHDGQAGADVVAVADQRGEGGEGEQGREDVEHAHARLDVGEPVADQEHARDGPEQRGAGEPAGDADDEQHHDRPGQRRRRAPAPAVVAEQELADRDQLLAQRRMDHQLVAGVVLDTAVAQHLPGLRDVVLLVEDRRATVGGPVQPDEPHDAGDHREDPRDDPAAELVRRRRGTQPEAGRGRRLRPRSPRTERRDLGDGVALVDHAGADAEVDGLHADDGALPHGGDRRLSHHGRCSGQ